MTAVNSAISFAGQPALPFGGVGRLRVGRIHGADGLCEFSRPKAVTKRQMPSLLPSLSLDRSLRQVRLITKAIQLIHQRSR